MSDSAVVVCSGEPGRARGLPANIPIQDLQSQKMEFIAPTHDMGNPNLSSEIFDTRQVCFCNAASKFTRRCAMNTIKQQEDARIL